MKYHKFVKCFLSLFLMFIVFGATNVNAAVSEGYSNICKYDYRVKVGEKSKKGTLSVYPKGDKAEKLKDVNDIKFEVKLGGNVLNGNINAYYISGDEEEEFRDSGVFVVSDGNLYCPTEVYVCNVSMVTGQVHGMPYDMTAAHSFVNLTEDECKKKNKELGYDEKRISYVKLTSLDTSGVAKPYVTKASSTSHIRTCDASKTSEVNKKITEIESKYKTADYATLSSYYTDVTNLNNDVANSKVILCDSSLNDKLIKMASKDGVLNKRANELNLDPSQKQELNSKINQEATAAEKASRLVNINHSVGIDLSKSKDTYTCSGLIDENLKEVLQLALKIIRIVAPILLIIFTTVDFSQAVISQDKDIMKKAVSKVIKRAIAAIAVFFIPLLVSLLLNMPGVSDYTSTDPSCGIVE